MKKLKIPACAGRRGIAREPTTEIDATRSIGARPAISPRGGNSPHLDVGMARRENDSENDTITPMKRTDQGVR